MAAKIQRAGHQQHLELFIGMKGGDGDLSYAKNCSSQTNLLYSVRPVLEDAIINMQKLPTCSTFHMADLGCSSSQNSITAIQTILKAVRQRYAVESVFLPEFHAYFNDLPSNDFDSLFRRLGPNFIYRDSDKSISQCKGRKLYPSQPEDSCYYSEVIGSFHTRLFSKNSMNFIHSSCSLHWLSKVPDAVLDATSASYNQWEVFITRKGSSAVASAYRGQFRADFTAFLRARATEVMEGGILFLVLPCRLSSDPREQGSLLSLCGNLLGAAFRDLVTEGLIEEEKLHTFNLPFFSPTVEELKTVVRSEGSFELQSCRVLKGEAAGMVDDKERLRQDNKLLGKHLSRQYRSGLEGIIEAHIGPKMTEKLFQKVEVRAAEMGQECITSMEDLTQVIAVLVKL